MSSWPGPRLEDFAGWTFDFVPLYEGGGESDVNPSLFLAEAIGRREPRPRFSAEQVKAIIAPLEPYREEIEDYLNEYSEEEYGSWRDYALCFDFIPEGVLGQVSENIEKMRRKDG